MLSRISELTGRVVYNHQGNPVGKVSDVILDFERNSIYGLYIDESNPELVEGGAPISIPYRLVKAIGEIILLKTFPQYIRVNPEQR